MCIRDRTTGGELPNDNNSEIEEVPNDETMEELNLQPEDTDKQTENKEDAKALVPEDTPCLLYTSRCV